MTNTISATGAIADGLGDIPLVRRAPDDTGETAQTININRFTAFDSSVVGDKGFWMGKASAPPRSTSEKHHHAEASTAVYIIRGHVRIYWGETFSEYVEAGPGDFVYVPPHLLHVEQNLSDEPSDTIFVRIPDNIVVNLGAPTGEERTAIDAALNA